MGIAAAPHPLPSRNHGNHGHVTELAELYAACRSVTAGLLKELPEYVLTFNH